MKKQILLTSLLICMLIGNVYAGGVTDDNNGNQGYIFVSTGENNGNNSIGHWTDPSFLKGEKGDTGEKGIQGERGEPGINGLNGNDGEQGQNGEPGQAGENGEQGIQGETGTNGSDGQNGQEGKKGDTGIQGEQGKGLEDRYEAILEARILDTKRTTWSIYSGYDFNNNINIVGAKCVIKFGTSYEEKRLNELEKKINAITEEKELNNINVVPTKTGFIIQKNY